MAEVRPRSQQRRQSSTPQRDAALIAAIAALIAMQAPPRPTGAQVATLIGLPLTTVMPIVALAMSKPWAYNVTPIGGRTSPTATGEASDAEGTYRAAYILQASRRWQEALDNGTPRATILEEEARWFKYHVEAQANRRRAASEVDQAAHRFGSELGWYAKIDQRTSPECREANGKNFNPAKMPAIGYPGSVHPHCRCRPGKAHATRATVYDIRPERRAS